MFKMGGLDESPIGGWLALLILVFKFSPRLRVIVGFPLEKSVYGLQLLGLLHLAPVDWLERLELAKSSHLHQPRCGGAPLHASVAAATQSCPKFPCTFSRKLGRTRPCSFRWQPGVGPLHWLFYARTLPLFHFHPGLQLLHLHVLRGNTYLPSLLGLCTTSPS